jgi:uncharacterized protein YfdQ (DUF2303 family)
MSYDRHPSPTPSAKPEDKASDIARSIFEMSHGHANGAAFLDHNESESLVVLKDGYKIVDLVKEAEHRQPHPIHTEGSSVHYSLASLMAYAKAHREDDEAASSSMYVSPGTGVLMFVADDHTRHEEARNLPNWRKHRATYRMRYTEEAEAWIEASGKRMTQTEFAEFLEDRLVDVDSSSQAALATVARHFHATTNAQLKSAKRLDNGEVQFAYNETVNVQEGITVPTEFRVNLRLFEQVDVLYGLRARFKYRANQGLTLWFEFANLERSINDAFEDVVSKAKELWGQDEGFYLASLTAAIDKAEGGKRFSRAG